ncbi:MAG: cell division protein FtsL [Pseudomonadaceae bacterium]|nr:cell division protein FtsL [Pseudomonadaceae bacterium]
MAKNRAKSNPQPLNLVAMAWCAVFAALLGMIVFSGLRTVAAAHEMRSLYGSLTQVQREQDRLLEEHSRLMLERGTLGSMQNIEVVAQTQLGMEFPEQLGEILE